ncbi:MAG: arginine--tRNA ligase [Herpetosiphonaceae bacterium]|nr:MAG: arginine--tRNA ligase [Herpetosiphonaceae bacterium]
MHYTFDRFYHQIQAALLDSGLIGVDDIDLQVPKAASVQADLALPCFKAAKARGVNPAQLAGQLAEAVRHQFGSDSLVGSVEATGPFLNFNLNKSALARQVIGEIEAHGDSYGRDDRGLGRTIVVDYSAPNVAKRMHVGHIRSTIIGQALVNLLRAQGYTVVGDNHLGDWGKQFGMQIAAIERWGAPEGDGEEALAQLEELYSRYSALAREDPALDEEARAWSLRLEQGDPSALELWHWIIDLTKRYNRRNYERLGVRFDTEHGESFYVDMTPQVIEDALKSGVAQRDEGGAVVVDIEGLPTFLLQRSDGGTLYHTRDLATIKYREQTYHPDKIIYVVEQRQELHFRQLFAAARAMGYVRPEVELIHLYFGTIFDAQGKPLSTRAGNMVYLEALLDDAVERAMAIVDSKAAERGVQLSREEREEIAQAVGIGAVIYNDLYQDPKRNITLDWNRMMSLEGNSATYLQYTHARCCSIIRRAGGLPGEYDAALLEHASEQALLKQLGQLPAAIREASERYGPYVVADWLYQTAREFAAFYRDCPVLEAATPELRAARLHLVHAVAQGLRNGLALLGIKAPERM